MNIHSQIKQISNVCQMIKNNIFILITSYKHTIEQFDYINLSFHSYDNIKLTYMFERQNISCWVFSVTKQHNIRCKHYYIYSCMSTSLTMPLYQPHHHAPREAQEHHITTQKFLDYKGISPQPLHLISQQEHNYIR